MLCNYYESFVKNGDVNYDRFIFDVPLFGVGLVVVTDPVHQQVDQGSRSTVFPHIVPAETNLGI